MKVAHVITGLGRGGAESALYRLAAAQSDPSRFTVISLTGEGVFGERLRRLGVEVFALECHSLASVPTVLFRLTRLLQRLRPEVVQTWMYHADLIGGIAAHLVGLPVLWGIRNSVLSAHHIGRTTRLIAHICSRLSYSLPSRIVSCSRLAIDSHLMGGYADKFILIHNGVDLRSLCPLPHLRDPVRSSLGIPSDAFVVGHVGRAHPMKDHASLFRAFELMAAQHPTARLLLAGDGLERGARYFEDLRPSPAVRDRIYALGARDDISALLQAVDVFVLSSAAEAFPNVVVEAMGCGVPCVVTDVGDAAEIVGATGWVCPPGSSSELATALLDSADESAELRYERSKAARRRVEERFSVEAMALAYEKAWLTVVQGRATQCVA